MGDKFDLEKALPMVVGDTGTAPAGMHHYAAAKGATVVSMTMMGSYVMNYVGPMTSPGARFPMAINHRGGYLRSPSAAHR